MTDEEFAEFYWSLTDEERIEVSRQLADFGKANKEVLNISDEFIADNEKKLDRYIDAVAKNKQVKKLAHTLETQMKLIEQRMKARLIEMMETESAHYFDDDKNNKSH